MHVNRRDRLFLRVADDQGRPVKGLQKKVNRFFRCHHTNVQHRIDPRLIRLIYKIGRHFDGKRIEVVAGYRHPRAAKNPYSPHKQGLACDFRVRGVSNQVLRDHLRASYKNVGVGYYPNSSFIHLDVRKGPAAFWIDYSGPGEKSLYSADPNEDLRSGRADNFKPATIDPAWAGDAGTPPPAPAPTAKPAVVPADGRGAS
jgi:uncharacterized protein YcbK (DUF882 family)